MKIFIGADHGGFELKGKVADWLKTHGYQVEDLGAHSLLPTDDYPEYAFKVATAVSQANHNQDHAALGIVLCRSGAGMIIAANKVDGVRAALASSPEQARLAREHNDATVLGLDADWIKTDVALATVAEFVSTQFDQQSRHARRVNQITQYERERSQQAE